MSSNQRVWLFHEGNATLRDLLGGKGANLAEMTNIGLPVPPGFTITTEVCTEYYTSGSRLPDGLMDEVRSALATVEGKIGRKLGDPSDPLLVSVRSGAKFSMPGMMDTILNLGLTDATIEGLIARTGNERFAYDAYRRLIMMFSDVVMGVPKEEFERIFTAMKKRLGVSQDTEVGAADMKALCAEFKAHTKKRSSADFPQDVLAQLQGAIEAVFRSWMNDRAIVYRKREKISDDLGTAVSVQSMVFGNTGESSGTGVHSEPRDRPEGALRRVPNERARRGCCCRRSHPDGHPVAGAAEPGDLRSVRRHSRDPGATLPGDAGHRVYD